MQKLFHSSMVRYNLPYYLYLRQPTNFFYFSLLDCFQHSKADSIPLVAHSLLYLLGAIIKGAQVI